MVERLPRGPPPPSGETEVLSRFRASWAPVFFRAASAFSCFFGGISTFSFLLLERVPGGPELNASASDRRSVGPSDGRVDSRVRDQSRIHTHTFIRLRSGPPPAPGFFGSNDPAGGDLIETCVRIPQ